MFSSWDPVDRSTPGFPVLQCLPELAQTHVHGVSAAIQPSQPLAPPSPPAPVSWVLSIVLQWTLGVGGVYLWQLSFVWQHPYRLILSTVLFMDPSWWLLFLLLMVLFSYFLHAWYFLMGNQTMWSLPFGAGYFCILQQFLVFVLVAVELLGNSLILLRFAFKLC